VFVDGSDLGNSPASIELTPGNHRVSVAMEGYDGIERAFVMPFDRSMDLSLALRKRSETSPILNAGAGPAAVVQSPSASTAASGRWEVAVRAQVEAVGGAGGAGGALAALAGARLGEALTVSAGAFITGSTKAPEAGVLLRASVKPFNRGGSVRPVFALELPLLFASSPAVGAALAGGMEWQPTRLASFGLELSGQYFVAAPRSANPFYVFITPNAALHF
jgi:hypothetical protein